MDDCPKTRTFYDEATAWSHRVATPELRLLHLLGPGMLVLPDRAFDGAALLVSTEKGGIDPVAAALVKAGASIRSKALVGSHATRYTVADK